MQKMNKEELIEYFIDLLGDNHVLEKYLSIDEIREHLNENIKEITYEEEKGSTAASFDFKKKVINFDLNKSSDLLKFRENLVHEFLHVLSYSIYQDDNLVTRKCGFEIIQEIRNGDFCDSHEQWIYSKKRNVRLCGKFINEGITQLLTEEILGMTTEIDKAYEPEKDVTRVLLGIIGKENMLNRYFSKIRNHDEENHPFEYFFDEILKRDYEMIKTKSVDFTLKSLLDQAVQIGDKLAIIYFNANCKLDKDQKELYDLGYKELCNVIKKIIQNALETIKPADDFERKKDILDAFLKFHNPKLSLDIDQPELVMDVTKVVFDKNREANLGTRIWQYKRCISECGKSIEQYCVEHEIINKSDFSKADLLRHVFKYYGEELCKVPDEKIKDILSNFSYKEVDDGTYELYYHGIDPQIAKEVNSHHFDENEYKRLSDDREEKNIDRTISRFTNSLIGVDKDNAKLILNEALQDLHKDSTIDDILKIVADIQPIWGDQLNDFFIKHLQEFYITKAEFSKKSMLFCIDKVNKDLKNIQEYKYQKVGSHYKLISQRNTEKMDDILYDEKGYMIGQTGGFVEEFEEGQKTCYFLYEENKDLLEKAKQMNQAESNKYRTIQIVGNDVTFDRIENGEIISETYTLNESGELELLTPEVPRRIVDDMSELDIMLMQETERASITVTDMKKTTQDMFPEQAQEMGQQKMEENH